jgi:putative membrane protein
MNLRTRTFTTVGGIAIAVAALAGSPAWAQTKSQLNHADTSALKDMGQANMDEIAAGQLALEKTQNDQVKKFAQMMVDDHTKALSDVQTLAQAKGVELPSGPDVKHKATMVEFKALSGSTFDSRYIKQAGVGDHENVEKMLKKTQANAKDADVKALAGKMLPVVEQHLGEAKQLSSM